MGTGVSWGPSELMNDFAAVYGVDLAYRLVHRAASSSIRRWRAWISEPPPRNPPCSHMDSVLPPSKPEVGVPAQPYIFHDAASKYSSQ